MMITDPILIVLLLVILGILIINTILRARLASLLENQAQGDTKKNILSTRKNERRLAAVNDYLVNMARMVAHDMRQPTVTILNYSAEIDEELDSNNPDWQDIKRMAFAISASAGSLDAMLKQLNRHNDIVTSDLSFSVPMTSTIKDALFILSDLVDRDDVTIVQEEGIKDSLVDTIMSRVWQNLIENGIYHNNSEHKVITLGYDLTRKSWFVHDNGVGLSSDAEQNVFRMFSRYSNKPGSGIGLSSVKSIVNLHGGRVWYEKNELGGTTFFFSIVNGNGNG